MRSLMIEHAAQIPEINPSAARFALDEMPGFVLVRIRVLDNIFSARDLHSSLFNLCFPHCVSLRDAFRFRALMMPIRAIMVGAVELDDQEQRVRPRPATPRDPARPWEASGYSSRHP